MKRIWKITAGAIGSTVLIGIMSLIAFVGTILIADKISDLRHPLDENWREDWNI